MSGRDDILRRIRAALDAGGSDAARRRQRAEARLSQPPRHPVPARAVGKSRGELVRLAKQYLEGQGAEVVEVRDLAAVPQAIAGLLDSGASLRMGSDPVLTGLPWTAAPSLRVEPGAAQPMDRVGVSRAIAAIAETGTLMLLSGPENPVTVTFLPETHVVVLETEHLVGTYEDALSRLRALVGNGRLPRTVNFVSGPSRTADIGGILVTGAHGPKRLVVVLCGPVD